MTIARMRIVNPQSCLYYHIVTRCVRRAFLCGVDEPSRKDYEHRRQWIIDRLETLVQAFSVDVVGYGVMSNHAHIVLHLNPGVNDTWSEDEVCRRWSLVYSPPAWVRDVRDGHGTQAEEAAFNTWIRRIREHLGSLSWFMKCLNEHIAKAANREDGCTGAFWEARFKSQALLGERALLACLAYVDLNPIRANMADTPEESEFTSIRQRLRQVLNQPAETTLTLMPFAEPCAPASEEPEIPCTFTAYAELVEMTGRLLAPGKRGAIPQNTPSMLERLGIDQANWLDAVNSFQSQKMKPVAGTRREIDDHADSLRDTGRNWFSGFREFGRLFE